MSAALSERIAEALYLRSARIEGLRGGALSSTAKIVGPSNECYFLKCLTKGDPRQLPAEARALGLLSETGGMRVPRVHAVDAEFLVLEWIEPAPATGIGARRLGEELARMHQCEGPRWGQAHDTWCGLTRHPAAWHSTLEGWFREERLERMRGLLREQGRLTSALASNLDTISDHLGHWLSGVDEKPALCHGDLWGGNWLNTDANLPHVIDPAPVYGIRDADLSMAELFGGFPSEFLEAYEVHFPRSPGYRMRQALLDLPVLLNHAVLFGGGYISQCERAAGSLVKEAGRK